MKLFKKVNSLIHIVLLVCFLGFFIAFFIDQFQEGVKISQIDRDNIEKESTEKPLLQEERSQQRLDVEKFIWQTNELSQRLLTKIHAQTSLLKLIASGKVIEDLEEVTIYKQYNLFEESGSPLQTIELIKAHNASYDSVENTITAYDVDIYRYIVKGNSIPDLATIKASRKTMEGQTDILTLSLKDRNTSFKANKIRTKFFSTES